MALFLISVYFEGDITFTSQSGVDYTLDPRFTLSKNENITFEEVKNISRFRVRTISILD
jgi:hypothetical protein